MHWLCFWLVSALEIWFNGIVFSGHQGVFLTVCFHTFWFSDMNSDLGLWKRATENLKGVLNPEIFSNWIEIITPVTIRDNSLLLAVDNDFYQDWIEKNYRSFIQDALVAAGAPADLTVRFEVAAADAQRPEPLRPETAREVAPPKKARPKTGASQEMSLNTAFTFESFVSGPQNSFAHAAAQAVSKEPGRAYNPLYIYGQTGLGKTHLMQAIGNYIVQSSGLSVRYVSSETFVNDYVEAVRNNTFTALHARYRSVDVLLIDDVQFFCGKGGSRDEFFHTFHKLYMAGKQIVITSDLPPKDLKDLDARLVSRFEGGLVTEVENPDEETRHAILRYKNSLQEKKLRLNEDVLKFMAQNIKSNVRSLEGALMRAIGYGKLHETVVTVDMLPEVLKDQLSYEQRKDLTCAEIQEAVVRYFDLRKTDMTSDNKERGIAEPRMIAMFLCRKLTTLSSKAIAKAFEREHATVLHAVKTIQARMQIDSKLADAVKKITTTLGRDASELAP
ncbi:MAG: chromosomal replication initiator protein DnaA [Kiritimatiellaeota bacterium]|nr:chromosomal replication initiator protein DnaA [Kiritimatiellota bacterium]